MSLLILSFAADIQGYRNHVQAYDDLLNRLERFDKTAGRFAAKYNLIRAAYEQNARRDVQERAPGAHVLLQGYNQPSSNNNLSTLVPLHDKVQEHNAMALALKDIYPSRDLADCKGVLGESAGSLADCNSATAETFTDHLSLQASFGTKGTLASWGLCQKLCPATSGAVSWRQSQVRLASSSSSSSDPQSAINDPCRDA